MKSLKTVEKIICVVLLGMVFFALYIYFTDDSFFGFLVQEDGFYENMTAVFLLLTAGCLLFKFLKFQKYYGLTWKIGVLLMAIAMFFGAGEEISWGQRIFQIKSSEFFLKNNAQEETNLHNMVVDGVKLNKIIFSNLLSICFGLYFLVLPILWVKLPRLKKMINDFGISVARPVHVIVFLLATLFILVPIDHSRKWEVWECVFAVVMFLIVYNPINNRELFSKPRLD